jgi:hypothetical protein
MEINISSTVITKYSDLMRTIQKALYAAWGKDRVKFTSAYPQINTEDKQLVTPIITYSIVHKTPGVFKSDSEIKPRLRDSIKAVDEEGHDIVIDVWGQMFDYEILFEVWANDGDSADELAEKFQRFMFQYTGYLKESGVSEITFGSMNGDLSNAQWRTDLIKRNLIYKVRLDEITGVRSRSIESINLGAMTYESVFDMLIASNDHDDASLNDKEEISTVIDSNDNT